MFFERGIKVSARRLVLLAADVLCIGGSLLLAILLRLGIREGWAYATHHLPSLGTACVIFLLIFYVSGMYERQVLTQKGSSFRLPLVSVAIGLTIVILTFYARFKLHIGRGILLSTGAFVFLSTWLTRRVLRVAVGYGLFSKNTLVVGEGAEAEDVLELLEQHEGSGYKVLGVVTCSPEEAGPFLRGVPVLGPIRNLREFASVYDVECLIVATPLAREKAVLRQLRPLRYAGIEIHDYVSLHEELAQEIPLDHIDDEWLMNAAMNSSRIHIRQIKRIMDLTVAIGGLVLLAPVSLVAALLVKLTSSGPVLYRQQRAGLDGRPYVLLKFRTMREDAEAETGAVWSNAHDQRVTPVGRFLRKWRIDEIPQLWNVLRGEMSLVGPRPERPEFVERLASAIPFYKERLLVPPGITGWAQVNYPYAASVEAARRKLQYDLFYIKNMSFFLDVIILLRTFKTILVGLRYGKEELPEPAPAAIPLRAGNGEPAAETAVGNTPPVVAADR